MKSPARHPGIQVRMIAYHAAGLALFITGIVLTDRSSLPFLLKVLIFAVISLPVFLFVHIHFRRVIFGPLKRMSATMHEFNRKEFGTAVDRRLSDEVPDLIRNFDRFIENIHDLLDEKNALLGELTESRKKLRRYTKNLENMVEQRTEVLKWLAITDPLTGLFNRRYFIEKLEAEFRRSRRYRHDLSLMMMDIDHFKKVNDRHGHQIGDEVLKKITSMIYNQFRDPDISCRYGGEEFAVMLPETPLKDAFRAAERMRKEAARADLSVEERRIGLTLSIGLASIRDPRVNSYDDLIKVADDNLYRAKRKGRNRVAK